MTVEALAHLLPREVLFPAQPVSSWDQGMRGHSEAVDRILAWLEEPTRFVTDPEEGWADADADGVPNLFERLLGLDPARADSDGDGLHDGIPTAWVAPGATTVPPDGAWHCSGFVQPAAEAPFWVVDRLGPWRAPLQALDDRARVIRGRGESMAVWSEVPGAVPDRRCHQGQERVVLVESTRVHDASVQAILQAPDIAPVVVRLGTTDSAPTMASCAWASARFDGPRSTTASTSSRPWPTSSPPTRTWARLPRPRR